MQRLFVVIAAACMTVTAARAGAGKVKIKEQPGRIHVSIDGKDFASYNLSGPAGEKLARPYLYPVRAPDGTIVTSDQALIGGDHPHHRSLWVAHGGVNGADHWGSASAASGVPIQRLLGRPRIIGDTISHELGWEGPDGKVVLREARTIGFFVYPDGARGIDVFSTFMAAEGTVVLSDTKEAGLCAVRVAAEISRRPQITNSEGKTKESGCWGKPAEWCDISGTIAGKTYGIAILDHPENPRHPARWHVREYGLMAANIFGLKDFERGKAGRSGAFRIEPGRLAGFHYRVVVHEGGAGEAGLDEKFADFAGDPGPGIDAIFNGEDLTGWREPAPNKWWSVENGILVGRQDPDQEGSVLKTEREYENLIFQGDFKFAGDVDSGIFLRKGEKWQCQIGVSRKLKRDMTCSIYSSLDGGYPHRAKGVESLLRKGEWNRIRILAREQRFRIWLNGKLVLDCLDARFPGAGPIGLQVHPNVPGMQVMFRNIRARSLGQD